MSSFLRIKNLNKWKMKCILHWIIFKWVDFPKSRIKIQQINDLWLESLIWIQRVNSTTELTLVDFHHQMSQVPKYIASIQLNSRNLCENYFFFPLFFFFILYITATVHFFDAFALYFLLDLLKEILQRGYSTTTWTKIYLILPPPPRVDKNGHFTY